MDGPEVMAGQPAGLTQQLTGCRVGPARAGGLSHTALFYDDEDEYRAGLAEFVKAATTVGAPQSWPAGGRTPAPPAPSAVMIMLPWQRVPIARSVLAELAGLPLRVALDDMADVGRNPARLIGVGQAFADDHPGEHVYLLWEPTWAGRSAAEGREVGRHEGLCNLAFGGQAMTILCLYDTARLGPELIAEAEQTHPALVSGGRRRVSPRYLGLGGLPGSCDEPLPWPAAVGVESLSFADQLGPVREFTRRHASAAGLSQARSRDLILAVSEIAANAVSYADGGVISAWYAGEELICQIEDRGFIADPLAGRRQRPPDAPGGHGLWLVNLVCDLVERRTSPAGTTTRLHMRADG